MEFDVLMVADPRFPGGTSTAVAAEARALANAGYRVGFVFLASRILSARRPPHPAVWNLVETGLCGAVPIGRRVRASLVAIHHPGVLWEWPSVPLSIDAGRAILVAHHPPEDAHGTPQYPAARIDAIAQTLFGGVAWAPVGPNVRDSLRRTGLQIALTDDDWVNIVDPADFPGMREAPFSAVPTIGRHSRPDPAKWPDTREDFVAAYPDAPDIRVRLLGYGPELDRVTAPRPQNWSVLPFGAMPAEAFLRSVDYFSYFHGAAWVEAFGRAPLEAMASGLPCLLPESFRPLFGDGAIYCRPAEVEGHVRALHADPARYAAQSERAVAVVRDRYGPATAIRRVEALIGRPGPVRPAARAACRGSALIISSNGIGMGHLTRTLAVARRLPEDIRPVLLTMSRAYGTAREAGFDVTYVPYFRNVGLDEAVWNGSLCAEVCEAIRFWQPGVVLFDGNVPYDGLIAALERFPEVWKVWLRRGLWRPGHGGDYLRREGAFDAVVEPGELAAEFDEGATALRRNVALTVPPVTYLRQGEGLSRSAARALIGLDPERPAVLLQLGSGNNFATDAIQSQIVTTLRSFPADVRPEIVVGEWQISSGARALPAGVRQLRTFPFARVLAAFDYAVAMAGYNTFHENVAACLPTLFLSNENPNHDDQAARGEFGAIAGFCLSARPDDPYGIARALRILAVPERREAIAAACRRLPLTNGADDVARYVAALSVLRKSGTRRGADADAEPQAGAPAEASA